ncbi:MAG: DNA methyltransferase [Candidatus Hodarchaeota archaeon]
MPDDVKDLDNLKPIDHAVVAKPHTPVYKMHRYFARRPWSVFRALIEHYSNPGSIILDPFCGGGVTVVEGLRLGRKVIGVDINPLATFITRLEIEQIDLDELREAFRRISEKTAQRILALYECKCSKCGADATLRWLEWSNVYECNQCHRAISIAKRPKTRWGTYKCHETCGNLINITDARMIGDIPIQAEIICSNCDQSYRIDLVGEDAERFRPDPVSMQVLETTLTETIPHDRMPQKLELRRPYNAHLDRYADFLTARNRVASAMLLEAILDEATPVRDFLIGTFLSTLNWSVRMCVLKKGSPAGWGAANFWTPQNPLEINVWNAFQNRAKATLKGKEQSASEIDGCRVKTSISNPHDLMETDSFVLTQSSKRLPLPDESVDVVITDPPYGGNVMYTELGNFFCVWVKDIVGVPRDGLIDDREEAVVSRPHKKGLREYRLLIHEVFKECHRVLKPNRWMVMTFHNREFKVWNAIHLAAHDAGFILSEQDGMIYQPPIQQYTTTMYLYRHGSMLGDFILSFQKVEKKPGFRQIEHAEIGRQIERLAAEAVLHHKGASLSLIYMKLMPWLLNNNLLDKISEKELVPYLTNSFEEKDGKWHLKASPGDELKQALEEYSRQHYKASYEELDFVPVEARIEYLIRRLLYSRGFATQDDILNTIYENLINSNMADAREIQRVLNSIAELVPISQAAAGKVTKGKAGRKVWKLREDIEREKLFAELGADVEYRLATSEESDHDLAIARLVEMAGLRVLKAHIGKTEQMKYTEFRHNSSDLPQRVKGMPKAAREIIEQIDVLWHNGGKGIVAAFEVERTTTITSGIDRFRNLLTAAPQTEIELYLVVPKSRDKEVRSKLGSPANRKDGLHRKIGYIYLEDLKIRNAIVAVDFEKIKRFINEGQ